MSPMRVTVTTTLPAVSLTEYAADANWNVLPSAANETTCEYTWLTEGREAPLPL
jgi:hypothetical protein